LIFSNEQEIIINNGVNHIKYGSNLLYEFTGIAGGGKTTIIMEIIKRSGIDINKVAACTLTGAAAIILRFKGLYNSKTIHSLLYEPYEEFVLDKNGKMVMDTYLNKPRTKLEFRPKDLYNIDLIIVDEAWMVPESIANEIKSRNIKIIAMGDKNQLPSINEKPGFLTNDNIDKVTIPMRQQYNSSILYIAQRAMLGLPIQKGFYPNDVLVIDYDELTNDMMLNASVILCYKNSTREFINNKIRHELLGIKSPLPIYGDKIICKKNNWMLESDGINLVNGLTGYALNSPRLEPNGKIFNLNFKPYLLKTPFLNLSCNYEYFIADSDNKKKIMKSPFSYGEKFDFAYATTVHSYQGSQAPYVIYLEEYAGDIQNALNYTAVTRASKGLIYVKRKRKTYY